MTSIYIEQYRYDKLLFCYVLRVLQHLSTYLLLNLPENCEKNMHPTKAKMITGVYDDGLAD